MAQFIDTPLSSPGAVTEPASIGLTTPSADSQAVFSGLPIHTCRLPGDIPGVLWANGVDRLRHVAGGSVLGTGLLAPAAAPDADPTGTRATATLDLDADSNATAFHPTNGLTFQLGTSNLGTQSITVVSALTPSLWATHEVLRGANAAEFLTNLQALVEQTPGSEGVTHNTLDASQFAEIEVSASNATSITFRAKDYGTGGNGLFAYLKSGTWSSGANTASLGSQGTGVGTTGYFESGANGSGSNPPAGSYRYAYRFYRTTDNAYSGLSPTITANQGAAQNIDLDSLTQSGDTSSDHVEWVRTTADGLEFYPGDMVARTEGTNDEDTDTLSNDVITDVGRLPVDETLYPQYEGGLPAITRYVTEWKGRIWGGGALRAADYTHGTATFTADDRTVTFSGAVVNERMIGRTIGPESGNQQYERSVIVEVDTSANTVEMADAWPHTTASGADYSIKDERNPYALYYTAPGLPNAWSPANVITGVSGEDEEGITGLLAFGASLLIFTRTGIFRLTGEDILNFQVERIVTGVGAINQRCILPLEGGVLFLAPDGLYTWGGGSPQKISEPGIDAMGNPRGIQTTMERINWAHANLMHAHYDQNERIAYFYVPLDGAVAPSHRITLDLHSRGAWGLEPAQDITAAATVPDARGAPVTLLGDLHGCLWHADLYHASMASDDYFLATSADQSEPSIPSVGWTSGDFTQSRPERTFRTRDRGWLHQLRITELCVGDGAFGFDPYQTIASSDERQITCSGATFPTSGAGLAGVPVLIVDADGDAVDSAKIVSNTATVLTLNRDMDAAPDGTVIVGGFLLDLKTGKFDLGENAIPKVIGDVIVQHSPQKAAVLSMKLKVVAQEELDL